MIYRIDDLHSEVREDYLKCGVYTITNKINGKMYVGSTKRAFRVRWRKHLNALNKNIHHSSKLQNAVNKYGINVFIFEILEITEISHTESLERFWLNILDTVKNGYNVSYSTIGGCLGCKMSENHKAIIRKVNKNNNYFKGFTHSEESKKQIKNSTNDFWKNDTDEVKRLKKIRRETMNNLNKNRDYRVSKKPITQRDLLTNKPIKEWDSAQDIEKTTKMFATSIAQVCKGKNKQAYGFKWTYKNS